MSIHGPTQKKFLNKITKRDEGVLIFKSHVRIIEGKKTLYLFLSNKGRCKVEFIQPSNWLYSVPNLLVIQHLVTLYLGGFDVRVVSEIE